MCSVFFRLKFSFLFYLWISPSVCWDCWSCLHVSAGSSDFWHLLAGWFSCCRHSVRSGFFFFFLSFPLTLSPMDPTHTYTHIPAHTHTHKIPGTCPHAEMPHYTSAVRPLNLLECHFYHRVCVPTVLHSTLPAWLVETLSFLLLQIFFFFFLFFSGISLNNHYVELYN